MKYLKLISGVLLILLLTGEDWRGTPYYSVDKFIVMAVSIVCIYEYYKINKKAIAVLFGAITLLFQPFVEINMHDDRTDWFYIELSFAVLLLVMWGKENNLLKMLKDISKFFK